MTQPKNSEEKIFQDLELIKEKEPEFYKVVGELISHFAGAYSDKYENDPEDEPIITKKTLYHSTDGKVVNCYQIAKYLQRYRKDPQKYSKSGNKIDLLKMAHYIAFECVRHNRVGGKSEDLKV